MRVFRERWIAIVVCFLLGIAAAVAITVTSTPTYQASTLLFLKVDSDSGSLFDRSQFSVQRVKSYPDLVDSPDVLTPVISDLHLDTTPQALASQVSATNPIDTVALRVTAQSTNPEQAAQIANAVSTELSKEVGRLESNTSTGTGSVNTKNSSIDLVLTVPAQPPQKPLTPNRTLNLALGAVSGLAAGLILAILLAVGDRRLRTAADIRRAGGLPLIGQLPRGRRGWRTIFARSSEDDAASAYDEIIANLQLVSNGRLPRVIALAPAVRPRTAKDLRLKLAAAADASGRPAIVVEAGTETQNSLPAEAARAAIGLSDVLLGTADLTEAVIPADGSMPALLPLGTTSEPPAHAVVVDTIDDLLGELRQDYDVIVSQATANSRPLELPLLADASDGVVLVAEFARTHPDRLTRLVAQLEVARVRPLGVLLVSVPRWRRTVVMESWTPEDITETHRPTNHLHKVSDNTGPTPRVSAPRRGTTGEPKESLA